MKLYKEFLPQEKFPEYSNEVSRLILQSQILNGGSMQIPNVHLTFFDKSGIISSLLEICGNDEGYYLKSGQWHLAQKPFVQDQLDEIEEQYEAFKKLRVKQGYESVESMPQDLLTRFYKIKAKMTVLDAEIEELQKRLKTYTDKEQREDDAEVLKYGPRGFGKLRDNVLVKIDGQKVKETEDGIMIIFDERSPYNNLDIPSYRKLCREFQLQREQREIEAFKRLQEQCKAENKTIPQIMPVTAPRPVSKKDLPPWPSWAKNYLKNEKVSK